MVVSFIRVEGQGHIENFRMVGYGAIYDENALNFKQGFFQNGNLTGPPPGQVTDYSTDSVSIRNGVYTNGVPNGQIYEYVFPKISWSTFVAGQQAVSATKYTQLFSNGVWQSNSATESKQLTGQFTINDKGYIVGFTFTEV